MRRVVGLLAAWVLLPVSMAQTSAQSVPKQVISCVTPEHLGCGCKLTIVTGTHSQPPPDNYCIHLHSDLLDGAPLQIKLYGQKRSLPSTRPVSQTFSFTRGERWSETYVQNSDVIRISYEPGTSTCAKQDEEECESFDVRAHLTWWRGPKPEAHYEAVGSCGC